MKKQVVFCFQVVKLLENFQPKKNDQHLKNRP